MNFSDAKLQALIKLPSKRGVEILEELHSLRIRANNGEDVAIPMITLYLRDNISFTGWLVDMGQDKRGNSLLFHLAEGHRFNPSYDVVYLDPRDLIAIKVFNAGNLAHLLSFGKIPTPPGTTPPTKLELKRKAGKLAESVSQNLGYKINYNIRWESMPENPENLLILHEAINDFTGALNQILQDPLSVEIISKILKNVLFISSSRWKVDLEEDTLILYFNPFPSEEGKLSRYHLIDAIENLF